MLLRSTKNDISEDFKNAASVSEEVKVNQNLQKK